MAKLPWEATNVRDENKMISLYIPEATKLKLKWLSERTGVPQQKILRQAIVPEVDKKINDELERMGLKKTRATKKA